VFLVAAVVAAVGFAVTWLLEERPLRQTVADQGLGDSFAAPRDATSIAELETRLSTLARRQNRHLVYARLTERAELDLDAPGAWLLLRLDENDADSDDAALAARLSLGAAELEPMLAELRARGLVEPGAPRLAAAGHTAAERMTDARCAEIRAVLQDWEPERHPEVLGLIERFGRALGTAPPVAAAAS
jgi:hypothetical protein